MGLPGALRTAAGPHDLGGAARRLTSRRLPPRAVTPLLGFALVVGLTTTVTAPVAADDAAVSADRPSPRDFVAPRAVTYESPELTGLERERAAAAVAPVFRPTDPRVAGQQARRARNVLGQVTLLRSDRSLDAAARRARLVEVPELAAAPSDLLEALLAMPGDTWDLAAREVPLVVAQTLRQPVRPDSVALARQSVMGNVDRAMDAETATTVAQLGARFVVANSAVDEAATEAARHAARDAVEPVVTTIATGQTIVRAGDIVTAEHLEALTALGLQPGQLGWRDVLAVGLLMTALVATAGATLAHLDPVLLGRQLPMSLTVLLVLLGAFGARFAVPGHVVLVYAYPAAAAAMTLTVLLGLEVGVLAAVVLAVAIGLMGTPQLETAIYVLVASLAGAVALTRVDRLVAFLGAGLAVLAASLVVILAFALPNPPPDWRGVAELAGAAAANATLATGLAALGVTAVGSLFGVATSIHLLELVRPDHPLLREIQVKAPGTYHHSILLGNLAEAAAAAIGADGLLVRVGAHYHDVGKTVRPYFFVENQLAGPSPHEGLDAHASARIIIAHVPDGAELAAQHRLPPAVVDFIWQHHGTTRVSYFYRAAVDLLGEGAVDETSFRYPGPRPQSREAAILMLADGSEAAVRAAAPQATSDIARVVESIFESRLESGQLDESNLTLRDLRLIREAFIASLQSLYHPRIKYPEDVAAPIPAAAPADGPAARL